MEKTWKVDGDIVEVPVGKLRALVHLKQRQVAWKRGEFLVSQADASTLEIALAEALALAEAFYQLGRVAEKMADIKADIMRADSPDPR